MVLKLVLTGASKPHSRIPPRYARQKGRHNSAHLDGRVTGSQDAMQIAGNGALWLAPWDSDRYPGRGRILQAICGRATTVHAINHWRAGRRPLPVWAALAMADAISSRAVAGLEIAQQLVAYAKRKQAADDERGAAFRKSRAGGVSPSGLGARAKNPPPGQL